MSTDHKLGVLDFGRKLLETRDLDPVYVLLWDAQLEPRLLKEWLMAYWCFYHVGTASWITDGGVGVGAAVDRSIYWDRMLRAAGSKDYPRCHERRHFRGKLAQKSVDWLAVRGVSELFGPLEGYNTPVPLKDVMTYVQEWVGFGPWIAFKVADMLERLDLCPVRFDSSVLMYDSPQEGARRLWEMSANLPNNTSAREEIGNWAARYILSGLQHHENVTRAAPPRYERALNVQEAETILCKWNSYMKGHYKLGEDIEGCRKGLARFNKSRTSQRLIAAGKGAGLWS